MADIPASEKLKSGKRHWGRRIGIAIIVIIALIILISLAVRIITELLWYGSVDATGVYWTRLLAGIGLFAAFGVATFIVVGASLFVALRERTPQGRVEIMGVKMNRWLVILIPAAIIGIGIGWLARGGIDTALGWWSRVNFGTVDPTFGKDISFFVWTVPWWHSVASLTMTVLVLTGLATGLLFLLSLQSSPVTVRATQKDGVVTPEVQVSNPFTTRMRSHLSVIIALMLVVYGWQCLLTRYSYTSMDNGLFTGIGYTEQHARLIARLIVAIIAFICAVVFVVNMKVQRWLLSVTSLILMLVSAIVVSGVYPAVVQRVSVAPTEPIVQAPYIANNIAATRAAYGIDNVEITDYSAKTTVAAGQLMADAEALPGIRLIDPAVVNPTFEQLQQVRGYYSFPSKLDVDRYTINGKMTDAIVAAREINQSGIPDPSWNNIHTVYTHGYGMVAAYGNLRQSTGEPMWITGDIPPVGALEQTQPRIYFGEQSTTYAIVGALPGADPVELDTPGGGSGQPETRNTYDGTGGVAIGNWFVRALFALRYSDLNMILSERVNANSRILYDRTPEERVQKIAPWLQVDSDPFPAIVDGRLVWILDGYTTTDKYPNSQDTTLGNSGYGENINYIRNSVKATVDALDGTVNLYAWDTTDPLLQTWMKVYPGILKPKSDISPDLMAHLRYPQDLFDVQRAMLARYHMTDPNTWYQQSDLWQIPENPQNTGSEEPTYFLSIKWPGDTAPVFSQTAVYVPNKRFNLGAYLAVVADASSPKYGTLRALKLSDTQQIAGPGQTYNAIVTDQKVADLMLPYTRSGTTPIYGNLLTVPLGGGLIYVMPIYTQAQNSTSATYPLLRFVAVRFGDAIGIGNTLQEALDYVFQGDAGANTGEEQAGEQPTTNPSDQTPATNPSDQTPTTTPTMPVTGNAAAQQALADAEAAFEAADAALKAGDLAGYQAQMAIAQQKVQEAIDALG